MLENPYYHNEDAKEERKHIRVWVGRIAILTAALIAVVVATKAYADPVLQTSHEGVTVQLWDDKCALTNLITNLPYKATWLEKGKVVEGCWGGRPDAGIVIMYFADKTMGIAPIQDFTKVTGV